MTYDTKRGGGITVALGGGVYPAHEVVLAAALQVAVPSGYIARVEINSELF